jgi:hypothetical protein
MTNYDAKTKREKRSYNGEPIPEGMAAAPVWFKRDFVNECDEIKSECLTTWTYAGIKFLIGYVPVEPELYETYKKDCNKQINDYLKNRRSGRCIIGYRNDGTPVLCPKSRHCTDCEQWGMYERNDPEKRSREKYLDDISFEPCCEDQYFEEYRSEEEILAGLLEHLASIDSRYPAIIRMLQEQRSKQEICDAVEVKKSQGYKLISDCQKDAARFFGISYMKK